MVLSFLGLAGIYALLGATLVAAAQVLVYIGAISVLILFAIMLTQSKSGPARLVFHRQAWAGRRSRRRHRRPAACVRPAHHLAAGGDGPPIEQSAKDVATLIFKENVFAFEVVSLLLLAAVVGGIYLARRDRSRGCRETNVAARAALPGRGGAR